MKEKNSSKSRHTGIIIYNFIQFQEKKNLRFLAANVLLKIVKKCKQVNCQLSIAYHDQLNCQNISCVCVCKSDQEKNFFIKFIILVQGIDIYFKITRNFPKFLLHM